MENPESPKILALIPAYNEVQHIVEIVSGVLPHLPVLVVDDGSTDETLAQAEAAGATVLRQYPNQGKGTALQAGFRQAIDQNYEAVLTLDADGQHAPHEIPRFLDAYHTRHSDLIIGARNFSQMPPVRRLANSLGRGAFSWAIGQPIQDNQSGFRLISCRLLKKLLASREHGFEFEMEMIVICVRHDFRLDWVPISTIYAGESSHINPVRHVVNFLRVVWQTRQNI
ncbi:MAG: glycosyltransferase family 2 protein [Anaerolineae bacterium]|nr:glycosyltransferase family 2 protein [Anaerolineae bacterium]